MNYDAVRLLGVDLASTSWRDVGSAMVVLPESDDWAKVVCPAITWPDASAMTPGALGAVLDDFVRRHGIAAVSMDGPQGWRDPRAPASQGVGRAAERSARTPGKTGVFGITFPANQVGWISFSIAVFDYLLSLEHVHLANDNTRTISLDGLPAGEYYVLECFPTCTWRSSGLKPLPAKAKHPDTTDFADALATTWQLQGIEAGVGHDDLQAVVAGLVGASLFGWGTPLAHGTPASTLAIDIAIAPHRVEGLIWDACPPADRATGDSARRSQPTIDSTRARHRSNLLPEHGAQPESSRPVSGYDFERAKPFIQAIPCGRWSAYKDVAAAAGNPNAYMAAGNDLRASNGAIDGYWRVIRSDGSIADGFVAHALNQPRDPESARARLRSEGVRFDHRGRAAESQHFRYQDWARIR